MVGIDGWFFVLWMFIRNIYLSKVTGIQSNRNIPDTVLSFISLIKRITCQQNLINFITTSCLYGGNRTRELGMMDDGQKLNICLMSQS